MVLQFNNTEIQAIGDIEHQPKGALVNITLVYFVTLTSNAINICSVSSILNLRTKTKCSLKMPIFQLIKVLNILIFCLNIEQRNL